MSSSFLRSTYTSNHDRLACKAAKEFILNFIEYRIQGGRRPRSSFRRFDSRSRFPVGREVPAVHIVGTGAGVSVAECASAGVRGEWLPGAGSAYADRTAIRPSQVQVKFQLEFKSTREGPASIGRHLPLRAQTSAPQSAYAGRAPECACMHVCMYACTHACMHACMHVRMLACMHACTG